MPYLPTAAIDPARSRHPSFDQARHPNRVLVQYGNTFLYDLLRRAAAVNRHYRSGLQTIPLPLAAFSSGETLTPHYHVLGATHVNGAVRRPITMRTFEDRLTPRYFPSAYIDLGKIFLMGAAALWAAGSLEVKLVTTPTDINSMTVLWDSPNDTLQVLIAALAKHMAERIPERVGSEDFEAIENEFKAAEKAYFDYVKEYSL